MNRQQFIRLAGGLTGVGSWLLSCTPRHTIRGSIIGAASSTGHLLRDRHFITPAPERSVDVVIVGGGVSGLSAARHLQRHGVTNITLLELEEKAGGNAASGCNELSAFPWGAHYVPIPNNDLKEYIAFMEECGIIQGFNEIGLPVYNESYLCFDPQERLFLNGQWQDGLVPHFGLPAADSGEVSRFLSLMNYFRSARGQDGRGAFSIPVDLSSRDEEYTVLDKITMKQWMEQQGFHSKYLHEYVNYCCRDDFGTSYDRISSWVGIHYFASRKGKASNAEHSDVLTWPEGNGFLIRHLSKDLQQSIQTRSLATEVRMNGNKVITGYLDQSGVMRSVTSEHCILAAPQFICGRLLHDGARTQLVKDRFQYTPWMVANMVVNKLEEQPGAPASWDNVIHGSRSLGYVEATHEILQQQYPRRNITYYLPLTEKRPEEERVLASKRNFDDWLEIIFEDLVQVHPNIRKATEEVNIMLWAHAMAQPSPGMIHDGIRHQLSASLEGRIHFAHTDLAGISIFEEAFYQGIGAAEKILTLLKK